MPGKNKSLRWMRLILGGYDLSGDARTVGELLNSFGEADMTGWNEEFHNFAAGTPRNVGVRGFQALLNDDTAGAFTRLKDAGHSTQLSLLFGSGAEPAIGDPAYLLASLQLSDQARLDGRAAVLVADFVPDASQYGPNQAQPWGVALHGKVLLDATTTATAVDNGAASTAGGYANLHVLDVSSANFALKVQHSANGSDWSDLITFTSTGGAVGSELKAVAGTINRYLRFQATRTAGTITPVVTFARN